MAPVSMAKDHDHDGGSNGQTHVQHVQQHSVIKQAPKQQQHSMQLSPDDQDAFTHSMNNMQHMSVMQELKSVPPSSVGYGGNDSAASNYGGVVNHHSSAYSNMAARSAVNYVAYNELANLANPAAYSNLFNQASVAAPDVTYYTAPRAHEPYYRNLHAQLPLYNEDTLNAIRQPVAYKAETLHSPVDSGIGVEMLATPSKDNNSDMHFANYDFNSIIQQATAGDSLVNAGASASNAAGNGHLPTSARSIKHHSPRQSSSSDRGANCRDSPVHIPKLMNSLGFQYTLEAPISTMVRKEDDRMTYVNKGQFYTISMDYIPDLTKPLKSTVVRSMILVVFREEKAYDEEMKCWQFWHSRQHSLKQRILEIDHKNSTGIVGNVEELGHNAVQFYWNPTEQPVKICVAVQCLSTDFSNQKGVRGLPLHIQIDSYDEQMDNKLPFHRGYTQIKVFCDKGAERKLRDEERRRIRRETSGRKKSDHEYHEPCDRSEFYHMSNLEKQPAIFVGLDDYEGRFPEGASMYSSLEPLCSLSLDAADVNGGGGVSAGSGSGALSHPPPKRSKQVPGRVMLYVRKMDDPSQLYQVLHVLPPTVHGVLRAINDKFDVDISDDTQLHKQCLKGVTVRMDDDQVALYSNEDAFALHVHVNEATGAASVVTLLELCIAQSSPTNPNNNNNNNSNANNNNNNNNPPSSANTSSPDVVM